MPGKNGKATGTSSTEIVSGQESDVEEMSELQKLQAAAASAETDHDAAKAVEAAVTGKPARTPRAKAEPKPEVPAIDKVIAHQSSNPAKWFYIQVAKYVSDRIEAGQERHDALHAVLADLRTHGEGILDTHIKAGSPDSWQAWNQDGIDYFAARGVKHAGTPRQPETAAN